MAFSSVSVITSDLLPYIPDSALHEVVATVGAYGSQQADVNTSLTAVGLLWNMADFFGRLIDALPEELPGARTIDLSDTSTAAGMAEAVMLPLFGVLRDISTDARPEVRNSGMRTLVSTLVSHGGKLAPATWRNCLWDVLFPLLERVRQLAGAASTEEKGAEREVGRQHGRAVLMLVHHSRNTAQKQWDETLVLSLNGVGRLLRTHFGAISLLEGFDSRWESLLGFITDSILAGSREVALAAISSMQSILQAHAGMSTMPRVLWKRSLRVYVAAAKGFNRRGSQIALKTRTELVASLSRIYVAKRDAFDEADVRTVLTVVDMCARAPNVEKGDADGGGGGGGGGGGYSNAAVAPVQKGCIDLITQLAPLSDAAIRTGIFPLVLRQLLAYVTEAVGGASVAAHSGEHLSLRATMAELGVTEQCETQAGAMSFAFAELACGAFAAMYQMHTPANDRAEVFGPAVKVLSSVMGSRRAHRRAAANEGLTAPTEDTDNLWRTTAAAFQAVVTHGLPAVNMATSAAFAAKPTISDDWDSLAIAFESFLLADDEDDTERRREEERWEEDQVNQAAGDEGAASSSREGGGFVSGLWKGEGAAAAAAAAGGGEGGGGGGGGGAGGGAGGGPGGGGTSSERLAHALAAASGAAPRPSQPAGPSNGSNGGDESGSAINDWELELAVLDCLTDVVLPNCGSADEPTRARLVSVLTEGAKRQGMPHLRDAHHEPFAHVCLRKLFVLCSRGGRTSDGAAISVGRIALPALVAACEAALEDYAAADAVAAAGSRAEPWRVDHVMCVLEIVFSLTLDARVSDAGARDHASFEGNVGVASLLTWLRKAAAVGGAGAATPGAYSTDAHRERAHLFLMYGALVSCVGTREARVRERVRDSLRLVGYELGLIAGGAGAVAAAEAKEAAAIEAHNLLPAGGGVLAFQ